MHLVRLKKIAITGAVFFVPFLVLQNPALPGVVDRILASVNKEVITLMDTRVVRDFGLVEGNKERKNDEGSFPELSALIDRKVVIEIAQGNTSVEEQEIDSFYEKIEADLGYKEVRQKLEKYRMDENDLKEYLKEKLLFEKIISLKFQSAASVSLLEIEEYYQNVYVPFCESEGSKAEPIVDVLDEIEQAIKQDKVQAQVKKWIETLKEEVRIQFFIEKK